MKWIDLSAYGAELKKVELANNTVFPALVITDIEKYKNSGAVPLEVLKSENNPTTFNVLPGGRKGRALNTPIFFMTQSIKNGEPSFKIREGISKLLNISEDAVTALSIELPDDQINVKNAYMDFAQFSAAIDASAQQFYGTSLYLLKNKDETIDLLQYKKNISEKQHSLFPAGNIANIPFADLDKFGVNSSIFDRAFLNPEDASKAGYGLQDLKVVRLQGESAILPVSLNNDNSLNLITDMSVVTQLAYSNFEWKKNFNIIQDYNSLLAVRELTRDVLNARLSNVLNRDEMESHISKMAITFQNINELNSVAKTHKTVKFNNKGVATLLMKNKNGEWRYIEKNGPERIDLPLTAENYQKAIDKIAHSNFIVMNALALKMVNMNERDANLAKVANRHAALFKQYVKSPKDPGFSSDKHIGINETGPRVHKTFLDTEIRKFEPDVGGELYHRQVENLLAEISELNDSNNLNNIIGSGFNSEKTLVESLKVFKPIEKPVEKTAVIEPANDEPDHDILAVAGFFDGSLKETLDNAGVTRAQLSNLQEASEKATFQKDFKVLPKGISPVIDQNYEEANNIYGALQHITLSVVPWLQKELKNLQKQKEQLFEDITIQHISQLTNSSAPISHSDLDKCTDLIRAVETKIEVEKIKENILTYQMGKLIPNDIDSPDALAVTGYAAFNSDDAGNYVPFSSNTQYLLTTASLKNDYEKQNALRNGPEEIDNPVLSRVNDFVETQYKRIAMPVNSIVAEITAASDSISSINYTFADIDFNTRTLAQAALSKNDAIDEFTRIYEIVAKATDKYQSYDPNSVYDCNPLDSALINIARLSARYRNNTFDDISLVGNPYIDSILRQYEDYEYGADELSSDDQKRFLNPGTLIKLTDMEKLETLREIYSVSLTELRVLNQADVIEHHMQTGQDFAAAYNKAQEAITALSPSQYHKDLAGKFLVSYQTGNVHDKGLKSTESAYAYSISGDHPYQIKNISKDEKLPEGYVRLASTSFNEAVKDAFTVFQINSVAAEYGINPIAVQNINALSAALRERNGASVELLTESVLGLKLDENDLKMLTHQPSAILDTSGNRPIVITTPSHGMTSMEPAAANELIAKVALVNQLAGIKSNFKVDGLIQEVGNLNHFAAVHKYLVPDGIESEILTEIQHGGSYSEKAYSKDAANFAYEKSISKQAADVGVSITGNGIHIIMNQPESSKDLAVARIVRSEWNVPVVAEERIRSFDVVNIETPAEGKEILQAAVLSIMEDGINGNAIKPKFVAALNGAPEQQQPLNDFQNEVLNNGAGMIFQDRYKNDEYLDFFANYAKAAITDAIAHLPAGLHAHIDNQLLGETQISLPINMFVEETNGIKLPRIRFMPENAEHPDGFKLADQLSTGIMIRMVDSREKREPAFKLTDYDGDNKLSNVELRDSVKLFSSLMQSSGFDVKEYETALTRETVNLDKSLAFKLGFGDDYLKPESVAMIYGQHLHAQLMDLKASQPEETQAYLRFSNEVVKPYISVSAGVTAAPFAIQVPINANADECKNIMSLTSSMICQRTAVDIVNSLAPVKVKQGEITEASLAVIAGNFREQAKILSGTNFVDSKLDDALKSSPLWAKNDGENILITLAANKDKASLLVEQGMVALYDNGYHIESGKDPINVLQRSMMNLSRDGLDSFRLAGKLNNLEPVTEQNPAPILAELIRAQLDLAQPEPSPIEPAVVVEEAPAIESKQLIGNLIKEALAEHNNDQEIQLGLTAAFENNDAETTVQLVKEVIESAKQIEDVIETEYVEKLDKFPVSELNDLTGVDLRAKVFTNRMWPKVDLSEHAASGHQQLDTMILSKMIRDSIPNIPFLGEDEDRLQNAKTQYMVVKEMHGAISKSKTTEQLLENFREAHRKIIKHTPNYLELNNPSSPTPRQIITNTLLKASSLNADGMTVVDSLKEAARNAPGFDSIFSQTVLAAAKAEKLTANEKSFAFALNGYALDSKQQNFEEINQALMNRFKEHRIPGGIDLTQATNGSLTAVLPSTLDIIEAINKTGFEYKEFKGDLDAKWNIKFSVPNAEKQFAQGYGAVIDKVLTSIHDHFKGAVAPEQIGLGAKIDAGAVEFNRASGSIKLFGVDDYSQKRLREHWSDNLLNQMIAAEHKVMSNEEKTLFSEMQQEGNGLVTMVVDHGYKPKTEGLKVMVDMYQSLKDGFEGVEPPPASESLVSQSKINFTNVLADFRNEYDSVNYENEGDFSRFFYDEMVKKQDLIFKTIEDRMIKNISAANESGDLYPFKTVESNLQKVMNISEETSRSFINKHIETFKPGADKAEKEALAFDLNTHCVNSTPTSLAVKALEYRATMQMVELLDKHAPESIKGSADFGKQVNNFFPVLSEYLPTTASVDEYQSAFARKFVDFEERNNAVYKHDEFRDYSNGISKDSMVYHFTSLALANEDYAGLVLNDQEQPHATKLLSSLTVAVAEQLKNDPPVPPVNPYAKKEQDNAPEL